MFINIIHLVITRINILIFFNLGSDVIEIISPDEEEKEIPPPSPKHEKSPEVENQKASESLSIEETNKLRAKIGLKPLEVKSETSKSNKDKKKDDLGEFYHKPAVNLKEKAEQEKLRKKLAEHKEKRQLEQKLNKVKTLGDVSDDDDDVSAWINKSRKIEMEKKEAEKRAKELEELDAQFGISDIIETETKHKRNRQYTEKNLKGLRVEHEVDNFLEGRSMVLTLKDKGVLDEDEDVLVNVNLMDEERYKKNIENKTRKLDYNAYDDEEFDQYGNYKPKSLLSKYDEEIDGEKRDSFRLGYDNALERKEASLRLIKEKLSNKKLESLVLPDLTLASEYYNEEEMAKFKKPKKKVRKIRAKGKLLTADELEASNAVSNAGIEKVGTRRSKIESKYDIDDIPSIKVEGDLKLEESDDDFERALQKARKLKQSENKISDVTEVITKIKNETSDETVAVDSNSIVLNATAEFCRTLGDIPTYGKSGNREETEDLLDFEKDLKKEEEEENSDEDCIMLDDDGGRWNSVDPNASNEADSVKNEIPILDEEPDVGSGVGAALKLAMSKGYLDKEQNNRPSNSRLAHLQAKHYSIEDKSYGDETERGGRRERYSGPIMEFKEKDSFKPNVKLEYIDDEGRVLNSKEAFRYLSHKFHGKGPGKNKIEKRLKKAMQEGVRQLLYLF